MYIDRREFTQARYILEGLIKERPDITECYFYLGVLEKQAGNLTKSLEQFNKGLELGKHIPEAINNIKFIKQREE